MNARTRELLALHAGHDVTTAADGRSARCSTCSHTLLLDSGRTTLTAHDQSEHVAQVVDTRPCPLHVGELARSCRCCRADRLARPDHVEPEPARQPTADVATWAAACRAALPQRRAGAR